jgi:hypothetical protein
MIRVVFLFIIFLSALYFGTGGFIVLENSQLHEKSLFIEPKPVTDSKSNVTFRNKEDLESALQQDLITKVYPHTPGLPSSLSFIITAICFGIIGAVGATVNTVIQRKSKLREVPNLLLIPIQGAIIGIIVLGISVTLPTILANETVSLKPITVVFLSLFGGIFYLQFYKRFNDAVERFIAHKQDAHNNPTHKEPPHKEQPRKELQQEE